MKPFLLSLLLACNTSAALAQQYVVAGGGFGLMQFGSRDLDLFQNTYNNVNYSSGLSALLRGFDLGIGLSGEVSYRHLGRWSRALTFGYQEYSATDIAAFVNGVERNLKLTMNHIYLQPAFGITKKNIFVEGLVTIYGLRRFTLNSRLLDDDSPNPLTGAYKATNSFATDLGIAFGATSGPIMLLAKISYPVRKSGRTKILTDPSAAKAPLKLNAFPDDFVKFVAREPYKGVASDIDGVKVMVTLNYAFRLSARQEERE
ncbi:MAG: hypothetical protein AAB354_06820 [candidate division KSB1 bacterium]